MSKNKKLILIVFFSLISFLVFGFFGKEVLAQQQTPQDICFSLYSQNRQLITAYDLNKNFLIDPYEWERAVSDWLVGKISDSQILVILKFWKYKCQIPSITVISPNGGEIWKVGETRKIIWMAKGFSAEDKVKIYIDLVNGTGGSGESNYITDQEIPASQGSYSWTIGQNQLPLGANPPHQYRIRIFKSTDSTIYDTSDKPFSVLSSIDLIVKSIKPATDRIATFIVEWCNKGESPLNELPEIKVFANGIQKTVFAGALPGEDGCVESHFFYQDFNMKAGKSYLVTATIDPNNKIAETNERNNTFRGYLPVPSNIPTLILISPNGGEKWEIGKTYEIKWKAERIDKVEIVLTDYSCTSEIAETIASGVSASQGSYSWTIPPEFFSSKSKIHCLDHYGWRPGDNFKIFIFETKPNKPYGVRDESDNYFTIVSGTQPFITVISPNGGEKWEIGKTYEIKWQSNLVNYVDIVLESQEGRQKFIGRKVLGSSEKYFWKVENVTPGSYYYIKIWDSVNLLPKDASDAPFSIVSAQQSVDLEILQNQLASISAAISQLMEKVNELLGR